MELHAEKREIRGSKVKRIRKLGLIPAVIFSKKSSNNKAEVSNIQLSAIEFKKVFADAGYSTLIELIVDEKQKDVLVKEVQQDPVSLLPIHIAFYEVDMSQPIETVIPVTLDFENECEPVVAKTGILIQVLDEIKIKCLPKFIPQEFHVDVRPLKAVGDSLSIKDAIIVDTEKIEILTDTDEVIVKIDFAEQQEKEAEASTVDTVEVISEKEAEERAKAEEDEKSDDKKASSD